MIINGGYMYASYGSYYMDADSNMFSIYGIAKIDMANPGSINAGWYIEPSNSKINQMAIDYTNTYLFAGVGTYISKITLSDTSNYNQQWLYDQRFANGVIAITGTNIYVGSQQPGYINCYVMVFNTDTGNGLYTIGDNQINQNIINLASNDNYVYVALNENYISRINVNTTELEVQWATTNCGTQVITVYGNYLYAINVTSVNILQISLSDGSIVTSNYANDISYPQSLVYNDTYLYAYDNNYIVRKSAPAPPPTPICFHEDTQILTDKGYVVIKNLRKGDLVKTRLHDFVPIESIGHSKIYNPANKLRSKWRLYKYSSAQVKEVEQDLIITGCHSVLTDDMTDEQKEYTKEMLGRLFVTDKKYRLMACLDDRAEPYEVEGIHNIWHLALEHTDRFMNYGIYANGLLVETTSIRMMHELSGMELIE